MKAPYLRDAVAWITLNDEPGLAGVAASVAGRTLTGNEGGWRMSNQLESQYRKWLYTPEAHIRKPSNVHPTIEAALAPFAPKPEEAHAHQGHYQSQWPSHDEAQRLVGVMALKAAGDHAERVVLLEALLRESLEELRQMATVHGDLITRVEAAMNETKQPMNGSEK